MDMSSFIAVGENIHCTRIVKSGGKRAVELPGGGEGVAFDYQGQDRVLPVPGDWEQTSRRNRRRRPNGRSSSWKAVPAAQRSGPW